jgi:non-specific serine/threonine protein kinase
VATPDALDVVSFGELLRRHRLTAHLTQEELATRCDLGTRTLQNLERGLNQPRPETLQRLASSLGLVGEACARFTAAGRPASRGPRGAPTRIEGDDSVDRTGVIHLADWRPSDPAPKLVPGGERPENPANFPELAVPNNLPIQRTSFIGREEPLAEVRQLLGSSRLLTLTGTGGCGKTRLAIEVARHLGDNYPDGIWLVELAPLMDPALIGPTTVVAIGARQSPGKPIVQTLIEHLRAKQVCLVLDNCEHLIEGAAQLVDAILSDCPRLTVLVTSREALRIPGEVDWRVPSLTVPDRKSGGAIDEVLQAESVRLFVERARAVRTSFTLTTQNAPAVAQICRHLDGIPLAIELAATRVKALAVEQIAARLDQRFQLLTAGNRVALPRHQTLAAMVAWSYDLLAETERTLFNRLSVFVGGFTLEAAEAVCGDEQPGTSIRSGVIERLSGLVDKSLVVTDGGEHGVERYHLLETLRQYGRERLGAAGEAEIIQRRHAAHYLDLAEDAEPHLFRPAQLVYLARLDLEWDNLRAALRWYLDCGEAEEGLRLVAALEFFFWYRGVDTTEGYAWRTQLLRLPGETRPSAARAIAVLWAGTTARNAVGRDAGRRLLAEALAMAQQVEDERVLAWVMHRISRFGGPDHERWYGATEQELAEGALALYRAARDRWGIAVTLSWLGHLAFHRGDPEQARFLLAESLATARAVGDRHAVAFARRHLGEATSAASDAEAGAYLNESLHLYRELTDVQGVACDEYLLGRLDCLHGRYLSAREHYQAGLRWFKEWTWIEMIVRSLDGLAMVAAGQEQPARALRLAAASASLSELTMQPAYPIERADVDRALAPARQTLGEAGAATAWAEGQAMIPEQAIAYALEDDE